LIVESILTQVHVSSMMVSDFLVKNSLHHRGHKGCGYLRLRVLRGD
jgi:hypothetical protein